MNAVVAASRCKRASGTTRVFFGVTLGRGYASVGMTTVRGPRRLPIRTASKPVRMRCAAAMFAATNAAIATGGVIIDIMPMYNTTI